MNIDLNYDTDLAEDANGFGIGTKELVDTTPTRAHLPWVPAPEMTNLEAAIALAMEVCQWEVAFYSWCDKYLNGVRQDAMLDIPLVRVVLKQERSYWGPRYFRTNAEEARKRYYAVMSAQAALSAVKNHNKELLIQKIVYYTSMVERKGDL